MKSKNFNLTQMLYNFLLLTYKSHEKKWWKFLWDKYVIDKKVSVMTIIHSHKLIVNAGYMYPLFSRLFQEYNNPLLELAYQIYRNKRSKISIIDVGAAIGDTLFLLEANINNSVGHSLCIDGDSEFFEYLKQNVKIFPQVNCVNTMLSDTEDSYSSELLRIHSGTASAQGGNKIKSTTLDSIVQLNPMAEVDLLKIDVDGFDGLVLAGAKSVLQNFKPHVIFEWHPILYNSTNNSTIKPFEVLIQLGYTKFLFFTKYGRFSHLMIRVEFQAIDFLEKLCERNNFDYDWHYDIVALHETHHIDIWELAECRFSRNKKIPF